MRMIAALMIAMLPAMSSAQDAPISETTPEALVEALAPRVRAGHLAPVEMHHRRDVFAAGQGRRFEIRERPREVARHSEVSFCQEILARRRVSYTPRPRAFRKIFDGRAGFPIITAPVRKDPCGAIV